MNWVSREKGKNSHTYQSLWYLANAPHQYNFNATRKHNPTTALTNHRTRVRSRVEGYTTIEPQWRWPMRLTITMLRLSENTPAGKTYTDDCVPSTHEQEEGLIFRGWTWRHTNGGSGNITTAAKSRWPA